MYTKDLRCSWLQDMFVSVISVTDGLVSPAFLASAGTSLLAERLALTLLFVQLLESTKASLLGSSFYHYSPPSPEHQDSVTCTCSHPAGCQLHEGRVAFLG